MNFIKKFFKKKEDVLVSFSIDNSKEVKIHLEWDDPKLLIELLHAITSGELNASIVEILASSIDNQNQVNDMVLLWQERISEQQNLSLENMKAVLDAPFITPLRTFVTEK